MVQYFLLDIGAKLDRKKKKKLKFVILQNDLV